MTDRRLVITADDFGLHGAVNSAVETGHRDGVLSAASLMVGAPAADEAIAMAHALPRLRVGLHIVLTDGRPILPVKRVAHLVGPDGTFHRNMAAIGAMLVASPAAREEMAAEIEAQFAAFRDTGLVLDHANAHKHFHVHPMIAGMIAKIGARFGLKAVRIPLEPAAVLAAVEPGRPGVSERLASWWGRRAAGRFRRAGIATPDHVFGLRWTGHITAARLAGLVAALPPGLSEVYLHPATQVGFGGSAAGYDYLGELAALTSDEVRRTMIAANVRGGGFQDLAAI